MQISNIKNVEGLKERAKPCIQERGSIANKQQGSPSTHIIDTKISMWFTLHILRLIS